MFRERQREGEREGEKHGWVASHTHLDQPDWDLGTHPDWEAHRLPSILRDDTQPTEPHWSGLFTKS